MWTKNIQHIQGLIPQQKTLESVLENQKHRCGGLIDFLMKDAYKPVLFCESKTERDKWIPIPGRFTFFKQIFLINGL